MESIFLCKAYSVEKTSNKICVEQILTIQKEEIDVKGDIFCITQQNELLYGLQV
ncbi:hypothetical protein FHX64_002092 [Microbacter margulisiae]|uniref:Uncharacterized protein n=1 Tax=Microbacter margulisiae TaxID=1350067 RepID=A0A7W5H2T2_9PORP|nr:hypothetical protein [Microbacter margulisiae]